MEHKLKFRDWVSEAIEDPRLAAVAKGVAMAAHMAATTGKGNPVAAAKKAATQAVLSGRAPVKDLAKLVPAEDDATPPGAPKMMRKY